MNLKLFRLRGDAVDVIAEFLSGISTDGWTAIFTGGLFATALATASYAGLQWKSSKKHHDDQIKAQAEAVRPYVLVTVETSKVAFNRFDLVTRNIGKRPATEVDITLDPPPARANEMKDPEIQMRNMKLLNEPMSLLAPGQEIRAFYDNHIERKDRDDLPTVHNAKVSYKDMSGTCYTTDFSLDVLALKGMSQTNVGTIHTMHKSLEKIANTLSNAELLKRSPELEVHATTEPRDRHELRDLQERYDWAKGSLDLAQQLTRGRESSAYGANLLSQVRARQEEIAVEPFYRAVRRCRYAFGFAKRSLTGRLQSLVGSVRSWTVRKR